MDVEKELDSLLGRIYETTLVPERWNEVLAEMVGLLDGDTCHLVGWDRKTGQPALSLSAGLAPHVGPEYAAHYADRDPRRRLALTMAVGEILNCKEHFSARDVGRNEFFQDYLIPHTGLRHLLGATDLVVDSAAPLVLLGFQRFADHGPFGDEENRMLKRLLPHLRRSLKIGMEMAGWKERAKAGEAALDAGHSGVLAVSASGRVVWANPRGEAFLTEGTWLVFRDGRLRARHSGSDVALRSALALTLKDRCARSVRLESLRGSGSATVLARPQAGQFLVDGWAVLVLVSTCEGKVATVEQLVSALGLTPAEARLARALVQGESLGEYAVGVGVKLSTVKTQLQSVFGKTGVRSQKDLVRLLASLPAAQPFA